MQLSMEDVEGDEGESDSEYEFEFVSKMRPEECQPFIKPYQ